MRGLGTFLGLIALCLGGLGAFGLARAVGPSNRAGEEAVAGNGALSGGVGAPASSSADPESGEARPGALFTPAGYERLLAAVRRQVGSEARLDSIDLAQDSGTVIVHNRDDSRTYLRFDAGGRLEQEPSPVPSAGPGATFGVARLKADALGRLLDGVRKETRAVSPPIESMRLNAYDRRWAVRLSRGDIRDLIANFDGRGVRLSGEPDPIGPAGDPDSLFRRENLAAVLRAVADEAGAGSPKMLDADIRTDRASFDVVSGSRVLELSFGYEARLTGRELRARDPGDTDAAPLLLSDVPADLIERMIRTGRRKVRGLGLSDVNYVLYGSSTTFDPAEQTLVRRPAFSMYLTEQEPGKGAGYFQTDVTGRRLTALHVP